MRRTLKTIEKINYTYYPHNPSEYFFKPSRLEEEHRKWIDQQIKLFRQYLCCTNNEHTFQITSILGNFKTSRNLLFERQCDGMSLYEEILQTPGMKEVIELIRDMCDILNDAEILQVVIVMT